MDKRTFFHECSQSVRGGRPRLWPVGRVLAEPPGNQLMKTGGSTWIKFCSPRLAECGSKESFRKIGSNVVVDVRDFVPGSESCLQNLAIRKWRVRLIFVHTSYHLSGGCARATHYHRRDIQPKSQQYTKQYIWLWCPKILGPPHVFCWRCQWFWFDSVWNIDLHLC